MQQRTIIVHCHIFKNAGTTFDWALKKCFKSGFLCDHDDAKLQAGTEQLASLILSRPDLQAVSGHHIRPPLPDIRQIGIVPAVFVRHPLERIRSVYLFERKQNAQTKGSQNARRMSFRDYVVWGLRPDTGALLHNHQTRFCSGRFRRKYLPVNEITLQIAKDFLEQTPLVGLVDRFTESMVVFEESLKRSFETIDLSYKTQNIGPADSDRKMETFVQHLGTDVFKSVLENNAFDLLLYAHARTLLDKRIEQIPDFASKLTTFQRRCEL